MRREDVIPLVASGISISFIAGAAFIADCRFSGGAVKDCWLTGLPIMGIAVGAGAGYKLGYETFNPALRRREEPEWPERQAPR